MRQTWDARPYTQPLQLCASLSSSAETFRESLSSRTQKSLISFVPDPPIQR